MEEERNDQAILEEARNDRAPLPESAAQPPAVRLPRLLLVVPPRPPAGPDPAFRSATIHLIKPLKALARQQRVVFNLAEEPDVTPARLRASDLVLFCRSMDPAYDWILQACLAQGTPTVYDLDANLWDAAEGAPDPQRLQQVERYLRQVDRVRGYSQPLVERAAGFNPNTCLVRGCIDLGLATANQAPRSDGVIRITDTGERGAEDERFALYQDDLLRLLDVYRENIEVYWWGQVPELFRSHRATRLIEHIPDHDAFLTQLARRGFDIGLAPLTPSAFNLARSSLRFREYGAARIAGIYSDVSVYNTSVAHEKTGLLVRDVPGAWFDAMQRLITDAALRRAIQEAAYQQVDAHYRQELAEREWLDLIEQLLAERRQTHYPAAGPGQPDAAEVLKDGLNQAFAEIDALRLQVKAGEQEIARREAELALQMPLARRLAQQSDVYRSHPARLLLDRLLDRVDYTPEVTPHYTHLYDDSRVFFGPLHGFRLRPSANLQRVPYLAYALQLGRSQLRRISLAAQFDLYPRAGVLGVQVYHQDDLLVQVELPASGLRPQAPVVFDFPPLPGSAAPLTLRILARDLDVPLRVYEWQRRSLFGFGSLSVRPFIGLSFDS